MTGLGLPLARAQVAGTTAILVWSVVRLTQGFDARTFSPAGQFGQASSEYLNEIWLRFNE